MIFGDSYTFGDEVSDNETYSYQFAQMLDKTDVLNMGIHAFGHDQMLLYLQETGETYQPDLIILGYVWFDKDRNMTNFSNYSNTKTAIGKAMETITSIRLVLDVIWTS